MALRDDPEAFKAYRREYMRGYYAENRERCREVNNASQRRNSHKYIETKRAWTDANRDKQRKSLRDWKRRNPDKVNAETHVRRARLAGAEGVYTVEDIARITKAQGGKCACCRKRRKLTVDHIVPITKGGSNWPTNIQMLCGPCNSGKRDRDMIDFMQTNGRLL